MLSFLLRQRKEAEEPRALGPREWEPRKLTADESGEWPVIHSFISYIYTLLASRVFNPASSR